jgi:zinc protease
MKRAWFSALLLSVACGGAQTSKVEPAPRPLASASASAVAAPIPDPEPWRSQRPPAGPSSELKFPAPQQVRLNNGLTVMVAHKPVPVTSVSLIFRHGGAASPPGKSGLAALTARLLTEGTKRHPGVKLAEEIERLGTTLDEDTGRDTSSLSLSALTADVDRALALLGEVVSEPAFKPTDFERVRGEWLDGLRGERQAPERLAALATLGSLLGKPHGSPVNGSLVDVQKLTLKDVVDFHRKAYRAGDALLVVVGDVQPAAIAKSAERALGRLPKGESELEQPFVAPAAPRTKRLLLVDRPGAVQSTLMIAELASKRSAPGHEQRELLTTLFGGLFTSRLNLNLREEHAYTYGARAQNLATRSWGALLLSTNVRTDVTAEALEQAMKELSLLVEPKSAKPIRADEVARARADLVQSVGARLEYGQRLASTLSELWLHGLPMDYYQKYPSLLAAETPETLARAATTIDLAQLLVVVVGDRQQIEQPLRASGYQVESAPPELIE